MALLRWQLATALPWLVTSCSNLLVGKDASGSGSPQIAYTSDAGFQYGAMGHYAAATHPAGAMRLVYNEDSGSFAGKIKEAPVTYNALAYHGGMNEHQLAISETTFGGLSALSGQWEGDKRHGQGTETWPNGDQYTGAWQDGARCGEGEMRYSNGDVFTGRWDADQRHEGLCVYANGEEYEGEFVEDQRHGIGRFKNADGDEYEGEWNKDLQDGEGCCAYANGDVYAGLWKKGLRHGEGEVKMGNYDVSTGARDSYRGGWKNDKRSGVGTLTEANGDRYDGVFVNDVRQGRGTQRFAATGERYSGGWLRNMRHGHGRHHYSDGSVYDGQWRSDVRDGKGRCEYPAEAAGEDSAGTYDGQWKRDKKSGKGKFEFNNGDMYEGEWKNDVRHGKGLAKYHTGELFNGDWVDDVRQGEGDEKGPLSKLGTTSKLGLSTTRILVEPDRPKVPRLIAAVQKVNPIAPRSPAPGAKLPELLGRVTDLRGAPVDGVDVTVRPSLNSSFRQVTSAGDGSFGVPGLPVGGVRVMLDFTKDRYAALSKSAVAMPGKGGQARCDVTLAPLPISKSFDTADGATVCSEHWNQPKISIPSDVRRTDSTLSTVLELT